MVNVVLKICTDLRVPEHSFLSEKHNDVPRSFCPRVHTGVEELPGLGLNDLLPFTVARSRTRVSVSSHYPRWAELEGEKGLESNTGPHSLHAILTGSVITDLSITLLCRRYDYMMTRR